MNQEQRQRLEKNRDELLIEASKNITLGNAHSAQARVMIAQTIQLQLLEVTIGGYLDKIYCTLENLRSQR